MKNLLLEERIQRQGLQYRVNAFEMVEEISTSFTNIPIRRIDSEIERGLGELGHSAGADRAYLFLYSENGKTMSNTHEWSVPGVSPEKENLQDLPVDVFPWWNKMILANEPILIPDVDQMPAEAKSEKEILQAQGIQSLIVVPMTMRGNPVGFLGFDAVRTKISWPQEVVPQLRTIGEIFSNTLDDLKDTKELEETRAQFSAVIEDSPLAFFVVGENGTIILERGVRMLLHEDAPIMGMDYQEVFLNNPDMLGAISEALKGHQITQELNFHKVPIVVHLLPLTSKNGGIQHVACEIFGKGLN